MQLGLEGQIQNHGKPLVYIVRWLQIVRWQVDHLSWVREWVGQEKYGDITMSLLQKVRYEISLMGVVESSNREIKLIGQLDILSANTGRAVRENTLTLTMLSRSTAS